MPQQFQNVPLPQTAGQQQLRGGVEQLLMSILGGLGKPVDIGPIAQQARTQFQQQTVPTLAERFTSMGGGLPTSPAFASQLGAAGAGLEESLASLGVQQQMGQQDLQSRLLSGLLGTALQPQSFMYAEPQAQKSPGFGQQLMQGLGGGLGMLGAGFGQTLPFALGGGLLSNLFGKAKQPQQPDRMNALMGLLSQIRGAR